MKNGIRAAAVAVLVATSSLCGLAISPASASEIKVVVNNIPVTSYDIQRRAAFLRLQRQSPGKAQQDMIDQTLRAAEMKRLNVNIPEQAVDGAYKRFADQNKLSTAQLDQILAQSGVTKEHFREFIRVQMGWSQALQARFRAEGRMTEQDVVRKMLQQGGSKPSATEYMLQQVIFVVPQSERGNMARRKNEAEAMRQRFTACDQTREFAKGLIDVTVRDLGRVLQPELPPDWKEHIEAIGPGQATIVRQTDRGYEFIGICSAREVSDDRVAQMVFQLEGKPDEKADEFSQKYMADLKEKARIVER
ncbi:MAG: peptidylprolyl isomerase [Rhizobiaceae bacterium]|nr:peptidylprolyl isomerase [Rhizobiaceae bacterium]MCV0406454.1 peptidylprolyl isomerase [Rhizobiaceae bacterium]